MWLTHSTRDDENRFIQALSQSIYYRFSSIAWHDAVINDLQDHYVHEMESQPGWRDDTRHLLRRVATNQLYLFDDMVFAASSMFDYFGNLIGLLFHGPNFQRAKWKGIVKMSCYANVEERATGSVRLSTESATGLRVRAANRDWVDRLDSYRAGVIHEEAEKPDGELTRSLARDRTVTVSLTAFAPARFVKRMRLAPREKQASYPLRDAAEWLLTQTYHTAVDLSLSLWSDMRDEPHPRANQLDWAWLPNR